MADQIKDFRTNDDNSADLGVIFDLTGLDLGPELADNYTPLHLDPPTTGTWTQDTAAAALAAQIAESKAAFLAAAPSFIPPPDPNI